MMELHNVKDVLPELIEITSQGRLKWSQIATNDFAVSIGGYKIEIEYKSKETDVPSDRDFVAVYLWDSSGEIIDSYYSSEGDLDYQIFRTYLANVKKTVKDVPGALRVIISKLRDL